MPEKLDLVVRNGMLVYPEKIVFGDLGIRGARIAGVGRAGRLKGARVIDAGGAYVFPGFIDPHTHPVYLDNLGDTAYSAAWGGITTVAHYAYAKPGQSQLQVIRDWKKEGGGTSCIDFALHGGFFETLKQSDEIPECFKEGVTSFKMFLAYAKLGWMTDDYALVKAMDMIGRLGGMASVHAENGLAIDYIQDKLLAEKADFAARFQETSPDLAEAEAVFRSVTLGRLMKCPVYIPHVSSAETVDVIRFLRAKGVAAFFETCPHYLALTWDKLKKNGPMGKIGPSIKTQKDQDALWAGIRAGLFDTFGSDHAPKDKKPADDFFKAAYGGPGVETMLHVIWQEGVNRGRIGPCDVVRMFAENTARILGIFPRKGRLDVGSDGDVVIFDPSQRWIISAANQHSHCPYTLYEGKEVQGRVRTVISRGKSVIENGEFTGSASHGKFLPTKAGRVPGGAAR
ncbi:MAG: amidohydrolase family protein [Spirochaetales bacterium]|jgi:dihydropyrimidinase|nr:amidohydrolase family protein [Spirochaetales bacterium]